MSCPGSRQIPRPTFAGSSGWRWHGPDADPLVYRQGTDIGVAETPFGRVGFLVCGDIYYDDIVARFRALKPDWLLFPFARCFADEVTDRTGWDSIELPRYAERVRLAGTPALMVNYIGDRSLGDDNSFGGAVFISAEGQVKASFPLGVERALVVEMRAGRPAGGAARV